MPHLYELIQRNVSAWRRAGYPTEQYPAITEILEYATLSETGSLRFLRAAQLQALETYWYLRLFSPLPKGCGDGERRLGGFFSRDRIRPLNS